MFLIHDKFAGRRATAGGGASPGGKGLRLLSLTGILSILLYIAYFFLMQTHSLWQSPTLVQDRWKKIFYPIVRLFPAEWVHAPKVSYTALVNSGLYLVLMGALFAVFFVALRGAFQPGAFTRRDGRIALRRIFGVAVLAVCILFLVPGVLSSDLFSYIWYGRILVVFGDNPLTHTPIDYLWRDQGHWLQWVYWRHTPSVYGPVWVLIAGLVAEVSQVLGGDIVNHILGEKAVASVAHLANILLMWKVAGIVANRYLVRPGGDEDVEAISDRRASMQIAATLAYAWNPLIVMEFGANGHNDALMLTGILAAVWLHLTGRWRWAVVVLAMTAMVKAIVVLMIPGYVWLLFWQAGPSETRHGLRSRVGRVAQAVAIMAATWVVFYAPFWEGPGTLRGMVTGPPTELFVNSLGYVLRFNMADALNTLSQALGWQPSWFWSYSAIGARLDWPARYGPMLITAAVALVQTWKARTFPTMLGAWGWVLFTYLTIGAVWFWPWYVSWLVIIAALLGPGRLFTATLILSASSMSLYGMYWTGNVFMRELTTWKPLVIMVPPLAYVVCSWWFSRRRAKVAAPEPRRIHVVPERPPAVRVPTVPQALEAVASDDVLGPRVLEDSGVQPVHQLGGVGEFGK